MKDDFQFRIGKMTKKPGDMKPEERLNWQKQIAQNARNYLFSIGQPVVYKRHDGHIVAEHKDGRVLILQ